MKRSVNYFFRIAIAATVLVSVVSCGKSDEKSEGPAERAGASMGRAIDQAVEKAGPAMEKAGETLKETGEKTKEQLSSAVDKIKESAKKAAEKTPGDKN